MVHRVQITRLAVLLTFGVLSGGCAGSSSAACDPDTQSQKADCAPASMSEQRQEAERQDDRDGITDTTTHTDLGKHTDTADALAQLGDQPEGPGRRDGIEVAHDDPIRFTCSESDRFAAVDLGPLITYSLMGMPADVTIADNTSYLMEDGRVRLYFWAGQMGLEDTGAHSVLTTDGTTALLEEGLRIPSPYGHPKLSQLATDQFRIFHLMKDGLGSHLSDDGLQFSQEEGMRLSSADAGLERIGGMSVVALSDGRFRGYFSNLGVPGAPPSETVDRIKSATSQEQLIWVMDEGVRIGEDAVHLMGKGRQPFAQKRAFDCVTLFYQRVESSPSKIHYATASDSLLFSHEYELDIEGWDGPAAGANIQALADGFYRLFYDAQSDELGNHIRAATFVFGL